MSEKGQSEMELNLMLGRIERIWDDFMKSKLSNKKNPNHPIPSATFSADFPLDWKKNIPYKREAAISATGLVHLGIKPNSMPL